MVAALGVAGAEAQEPAAPALAPEYGGGRLATSFTTYNPSVLVGLRRTGDDTLRYEVTTSLRCGSGLGTYPDLTVRGTARLAGDRLLVTRTQRVGRTYAERLTLRYTLDLRVGPERATGVVRVSGTARSRGRAVPCRARPVRKVKLHARGAVTGAAGTVPARQTYAGVIAIAPNPVRPALVVQADTTGRRLLAVWDARARCSRGPTERFTNRTPPMTVRGGRALVRERFVIRFLDGVRGHYQATFDGRVRADGIRGTVRLRIRFSDARGRTTARCDSGQQRFTAVPVPRG